MFGSVHYGFTVAQIVAGIMSLEYETLVDDLGFSVPESKFRTYPVSFDKVSGLCIDAPSDVFANRLTHRSVFIFNSPNSDEIVLVKSRHCQERNYLPDLEQDEYVRFESDAYRKTALAALTHLFNV